MVNNRSHIMLSTYQRMRCTSQRNTYDDNRILQLAWQGRIFATYLDRWWRLEAWISNITPPPCSVFEYANSSNISISNSGNQSTCNKSFSINNYITKLLFVKKKILYLELRLYYMRECNFITCKICSIRLDWWDNVHIGLNRVYESKHFDSIISILLLEL